MGPRAPGLAYRMLVPWPENIWARPSTFMAAASIWCFPHHENEIAQSEGAHCGHPIAKVWMHNGFLQVEGEKMSKSAGNFFTIRELLADWPGEVLRFNMLRTHYRQPIDFTVAGLKESWKTLERWYEVTEPLANPAPNAEFFEALSDDLNTPAAIASLHQADEMALAGGLGFLGFSNVQLGSLPGPRLTLWPSPTPLPPAMLRARTRTSRNPTAFAMIFWPRALC